MHPLKNLPFLWPLLIGDIFVLAGVTLSGFATHGKLAAAGSRPLATFVPFLFAWLLVAPHLEVFDAGSVSQMRSLWRPIWAMLLAAPLGALLRALWLGTDVVPIFVLVFGGITALAILVWRAAYWALVSRKAA